MKGELTIGAIITSFQWDGGLLTVFDDGSEAIYSQYEPLVEYHYYYELLEY
jgi:hypothetical protein